MCQRLHHVIFDAGQRYSEFALDLPIWHLIEAVHDEYGARSLGQSAQRQRQRCFEFVCFELMFLFGGTPAFDRLCRRNRNDLATLTARLVDKQILGDPVQKCARIGKRCKLRTGGGTQEYLLYKVICKFRADPFGEVTGKSCAFLSEHLVKRTYVTGISGRDVGRLFWQTVYL